jgi:ABC-type lipoprotein release transport system permease subunit
MYAQVASRVREVGTLRALGFRRRSVLGSFLVESLILSLLGAVAGCVFASFLAATWEPGYCASAGGRKRSSTPSPRMRTT